MRFPLICLFLFLSACADPTYIRQEADGAGALEKMRYDCALQFTAAGPSSGLCVTWAWEKKPEIKAEGRFFFRFYRTSGIDGFPIPASLEDQVRIELYMPDMGHGSTPVTVASVTGEPGLFHASDVNFLAMNGVWEIRFQIFKNGIKVDEVADRIHFIF